MTTIGSLITTPSGLARVVQVLPTRDKRGSQDFSDVVAEPLGGSSAQASQGAGKTGASTRNLNSASVIAAILQQSLPSTSNASTSSTAAVPGAAKSSGSKSASSSASKTPPRLGAAAAAAAYEASQLRGQYPTGGTSSTGSTLSLFG